MLQIAATPAVLLVLGGLVFCVICWFRCERRLRALERKLQQFSEALGQMAEIQMNEHQKVSGNLNDIEERIWNLTAPDTRSTSPLDRKHQVLTMSRNGFGLDEITKRLNIPKGEAELILSLTKYIGGSGCAPSVQPRGDDTQYAQA